MFNKDTFSVKCDGKLMRTKDSLLAHISSKLMFPDYFGKNWDALDECLADLSWINSKKIEVSFINDEFILSDGQKDQIDIFLSCLNDANKYWSNSQTKIVIIYMPNFSN